MHSYLEQSYVGSTLLSHAYLQSTSDPVEQFLHQIQGTSIFAQKMSFSISELRS